MPKKIRKIRNVGTVENRSSIVDILKNPGDLVLIERGRPRSIVMLCPCGCGEELTVNLDKRVTKAWRLYRSKNNLTLYPSVWRESGCYSHFIVWNNRITWCDYESLYQDEEDSDLETRILDILGKNIMFNYVDIADSLDEIPWLVLVACRRLVRRDVLVEGGEQNKGNFHMRKMYE